MIIGNNRGYARMEIKINFDENALEKIIETEIQKTLLPLIGETVLQTIIKRFKVTNTAPDGTLWKPLSDYTLRMRRKGSGKRWDPEALKRGEIKVIKVSSSDRILIDTGTLLRSITYKETPSAIKVIGNTVYVGTNAPYAQKNNEGFGKLNPKRQFIGALNEEDLKEVEKSIKQYFKQ
jgi:phage gpG-like protein